MCGPIKLAQHHHFFIEVTVPTMNVSFRCINFASVSTIYDQNLELLFFEFCHFGEIVLKPSNSGLMQHIIKTEKKHMKRPILQ
jgi:hypothetical protein